MRHANNPPTADRLPAMLSALLVAVLLLLLAACGGNQQAETPATAEPAAEEPTAQAATPTAQAAEPTEAPAPTDQIQASGPAVCEPVEVPENPFIAQVSDKDWVKGPENAAITLIEYGDFQ